MLSGGKGSSGANVGLAAKTTTPFPTKDPLGGGCITSPRTGADPTTLPRSSSAGLLKGGTPPSPNGNVKGKGYLYTPGTRPPSPTPHPRSRPCSGEGGGTPSYIPLTSAAPPSMLPGQEGQWEGKNSCRTPRGHGCLPPTEAGDRHPQEYPLHLRAGICSVGGRASPTPIPGSPEQLPLRTRQRNASEEDTSTPRGRTRTLPPAFGPRAWTSSKGGTMTRTD